MQFARKILISVGLAVFTGCNGEVRDFTVQDFEKAAVVGAHNPNKDKDEISVKTSAGINATVLFLSHTAVWIKFEDEKTKRKIEDTGWIAASEVRQGPGQDLLFLKITSSHLTRYNEWQKDEKLLVYKLSSRKLIGSASLNGRDH